ncbi:MAG: hypothetical protein C0P66_012875, partial [Bacillaceae bacterium]
KLSIKKIYAHPKLKGALSCSVFKVQSKRDFQIVTQPRMIVKKSFLQVMDRKALSLATHIIIITF